jgi:hypothetical protein
MLAYLPACTIPARCLITPTFTVPDQRVFRCLSFASTHTNSSELVQYHLKKSIHYASSAVKRFNTNIFCGRDGINTTCRGITPISTAKDYTSGVTRNTVPGVGASSSKK